MRQTIIRAIVLCGMITLTVVCAQAQTYFYVGTSGGDFFDEANWNTLPDGSGSIIPGDPLQDDQGNAIALDLVIDGDTVEANGQVDFGPGSLTLEFGSVLNVTGAGNDLDINDDSTFSLTVAALIVDDIINFEGTSSFLGGLVYSLTNDIAFQDNFANLSIDGTTFFASDNLYFDGFVGSIANATIISSDRLGVRNNVPLVVTDTVISVNSGSGDVDDVFGAAALGSSLTLLGSSQLLADSVEEGAALILEDSSTATMGGQGIRIVDASGSTITLNSADATLHVGSLDTSDADYTDPRPLLINGLTGLSYADDPSTWNISNWDGFSAESLQIRPIPEPSSMLLTVLGLTIVGRRRRRL